MKSKLNVEFDFDNSQPYIQLMLDTHNPDERNDMRDTVLKNFVERANKSGIVVLYDGMDNNAPQLRIGNRENDLNWAGCNATYLAENDPKGVYKKGESYNLDVATGVGHAIRVRHHVTAVMKEYSEDKVYQDLKTFTTVWQIN